MSDSTQLADQYLLQSSHKADTSINVSRGKSVAIVNDSQTGSYASGIITFDCASALNGSTGYASLKDSYIVLPFCVSMKNTAASALSAGAYPTRYALGLKCNVANVIDEVKVYLNGKSIITPSEYKQIWSNVRAITELTAAEVEKHGADMFLYPDDWESTKYNATATDVGDGYCNNMLAGSSSLALVGANDATRREPVRSNTGFQRRVLNNPPEVSTNSHGWPSLASGSSQAIAQMRGTGAFKKGTNLTQGSTLGEWFYMLKIRLVDLHPIFNEIDLVGNPQLKLELKVQTGYSNLTLTPAADLAVRAMKLDSTTLVAGTVCPVMIGSSTFVSSLVRDSMYDVIGTTGSSDKLQVAWGPIHNSITTIATSGSYYPFTQARLNIPFYDIANPTSIVSKPMKTIKYLDCYSQMFSAGEAGKGLITNNKSFSIQVSSSHKNVKYIALLPFANTETGNFATATVQTFASPFDSAPWTHQPGSSIRDFQVQVGNKNVFQDVHSYDWMTFLDEFSKIGAINGDLSREISNGLIGIDKWQTTQRILVADRSRISEADVPQSVKVSGTNIATQGTNLLILVVYERSLELDRITGEIYRAD
jgi:hypothetical protein